MRLSPSLDDADGVFRAAYGKAREDSEFEAALLVVLADEVALHMNGERHAFPYSHTPFHTAKAVAHVAVALYSMTNTPEGAPLAVETVARLEAIRVYIADALSGLGTGDEASELERELVPILESSLAFAQTALGERRAPFSGRADFARTSGERVMRATELATAGQISALHDAFEQVLALLSPDDRGSLQVVVAGDHQARSRSLAMQYFQRRFGEAEGADDRVTYGENVADEAQAIALVGTRRLDFALARAFFGDEKRLQRDVLADAAKTCLDRLDLRVI